MSPISCLVVPSALLLMLTAPLGARPSASEFESWKNIRGKSICRAQVAYDQDLQLHEVWCDDGVEGRVFEASGELFICRTVRLSVPLQDSDVDVAAGCVAVREG